jgi:hypothetical protein
MLVNEAKLPSTLHVGVDALISPSKHSPLHFPHMRQIVCNRRSVEFPWFASHSQPLASVYAFRSVEQSISWVAFVAVPAAINTIGNAFTRDCRIPIARILATNCDVDMSMAE